MFSTKTVRLCSETAANRIRSEFRGVGPWWPRQVNCCAGHFHTAVRRPSRQISLSGAGFYPGNSVGHPAALIYVTVYRVTYDRRGMRLRDRRHRRSDRAGRERLKECVCVFTAHFGFFRSFPTTNRYNYDELPKLSVDLSSALNSPLPPLSRPSSLLSSFRRNANCFFLSVSISLVQKKKKFVIRRRRAKHLHITNIINN